MPDIYGQLGAPRRLVWGGDIEPCEGQGQSSQAEGRLVLKKAGVAARCARERERQSGGQTARGCEAPVGGVRFVVRTMASSRRRGVSTRALELDGGRGSRVGGGTAEPRRDRRRRVWGRIEGSGLWLEIEAAGLDEGDQEQEELGITPVLGVTCLDGSAWEDWGGGWNRVLCLDGNDRRARS